MNSSRFVAMVNAVVTFDWNQMLGRSDTHTYLSDKHHPDSRHSSYRRYPGVATIQRDPVLIWEARQGHHIRQLEFFLRRRRIWIPLLQFWIDFFLAMSSREVPLSAGITLGCLLIITMNFVQILFHSIFSRAAFS
jgi:hypothetical protein